MNAEELLVCTHAEVAKALGVRNFFFALYDTAAGELDFKLEVREGRVLPERRCSASGTLAGHVVRTGRPLLICENFAAAAARLGLHPGVTARSYCAAPLLLRGTVLGVLGVHSSAQDNACDRTGLDRLTAIASHAALAWENLQLSARARSRHRHLELLNNLSRTATSRLPSGQMLRALAAELESVLSYDHISVGLLDYAAAGVVIRAEAGPGAGGLNRRFQLGEGVIGRVAQSGALERIDCVADADPPSTVLPDAASVLCLPIVHRAKVLGVLNLESRRSHAFTEEDVSLLQIVVNLLALGLQNSPPVARAEETPDSASSIRRMTSGELLEQVEAGWSHCLRTNRPLSLLVADIDTTGYTDADAGTLEAEGLLRRVDRLLRENVRTGDLVALCGPGRFAVLLREFSSEQAEALGHKMQSWFAGDPLLRETGVKASIGVAALPQDASTPLELWESARDAVQLAKCRGGSRCVRVEPLATRDPITWKQEVLQARLGVAAGRLTSTGPEPYEEIVRRLEQAAAHLQTPPPTESRADARTSALEDSLTGVAAAVDALDEHARGHSRNVARYCVQAARHLNLPPQDTESLRRAALWHDLGKLGIEPDLLLRPQPLGPHEQEIVRNHVTLGVRLIALLPGSDAVQRIVRHHHERWDGQGYPGGLQGDAIPLGSRLLALADAFDTLVTAQSYRTPRGLPEAIDELNRSAGSQFDPRLTGAFVELISREVKQTAPAAS